ncbi:Uncharacterised protein [uncultured archaeon]|nr:Uncharacterised protein [uncultured archaeon]
MSGWIMRFRLISLLVFAILISQNILSAETPPQCEFFNINRTLLDLSTNCIGEIPISESYDCMQTCRVSINLSNYCLSNTPENKENEDRMASLCKGVFDAFENTNKNKSPSEVFDLRDRISIDYSEFLCHCSDSTSDCNNITKIRIAKQYQNLILDEVNYLQTEAKNRTNDFEKCSWMVGAYQISKKLTLTWPEGMAYCVQEGNTNSKQFEEYQFKQAVVCVDYCEKIKNETNGVDYHECLLGKVNGTSWATEFYMETYNLDYINATKKIAIDFEQVGDYRDAAEKYEALGVGYLKTEYKFYDKLAALTGDTAINDSMYYMLKSAENYEKDGNISNRNRMTSAAIYQLYTHDVITRPLWFLIFIFIFVIITILLTRAVLTKLNSRSTLRNLSYDDRRWNDKQLSDVISVVATISIGLAVFTTNYLSLPKEIIDLRESKSELGVYGMTIIKEIPIYGWMVTGFFVFLFLIIMLFGLKLSDEAPGLGLIRGFVNPNHAPEYVVKKIYWQAMATSAFIVFLILLAIILLSSSLYMFAYA